MESLISLPIFDVFSYLIVGLVLIASYDLIFDARIFFQANWGLSRTTTTVIAAYVLGHVITFASVNLFDGLIVDDLLCRPTIHLMYQPTAKEQDQPRSLPSRLGEALLSNYFVPLTDNVRQKINLAAKDIKCPDKYHSCEQLFWLAYNTVKENKDAFDRITTFYQLEIFCRNISFACLLVTVMLLVKIAKQSGKETDAKKHTSLMLPHWLSTPPWQCAAFFFVGLVMFTRYLYFIRAHTIEVLTSYAYLHG
jgi:hypothetical protein